MRKEWGVLSCRDVTERASEYLDGDLPRWQRLRVRLHLFICRDCRRYVRQLRAVVDALRRLPSTTVSDETVRSLFESINRSEQKD